MSERRSPVDEPRASTFLRTLVYAVVAATLTFPITVPLGVFGAVAGAVVGSLLGRAIAATTVRTPFPVMVALALAWLGAAAASALVGSPDVADRMGPSAAFEVGEALGFGSSALALAVALRFLSARMRAFAFVEASLVAVAFAGLVVSHRNGALHRPYAIADPILERGGDPSVAILTIGALAALTIGLLLMSERSLLRSVAHVVVVFALLALVLFTTHVAGLPPPPPSGDGLALRDDDSQGRGQGGGSGGGRGQSSPDFQDEYQQSQAPTPVAIVLLHDDYSPPSGAYYFRQDAFSQFNGRRLVAAQLAGADQDVSPTFPAHETRVPDAPEAGSFRSTVETTVGLLADHPRPFGLESSMALFPATNPDTSHFRRVFRVRSASLTADAWSLLGRRAGNPEWSAELRELYTRGPTDPRYRELAERIISTLPESHRDDSYARALAITDYLSEQGTYSLRSQHASASDPTAHFLFGDLTGYCVHFAHASVFLMRSIGLPARVATGYLVPESGRRGGSALLINGQASHAWPEVYLAGVGWVVVDVSPQRSMDPAPGSADEELQQVLAELLRGNRVISDDGSEPPTPLTQLASSASRWLRTGLGALVLALVAGAYARRTWRRLAPRWGRRSHVARATYRACLDLLAEHGIVRLEGESHEAFASRLRGTIPTLALLARWAEAERYGGGLPVDIAARASECRKSVRRELASHQKLWRRTVAFLDPFSSLRVR